MEELDLLIKIIGVGENAHAAYRLYMTGLSDESSLKRHLQEVQEQVTVWLDEANN